VLRVALKYKTVPATMSSNDSDRHVKFDEATIAEHDKLRGTRQKIDEPDTPFRRDSMDSGSEMDSGTEEMLMETAKNTEVVFDTSGLQGSVENGPRNDHKGKGAPGTLDLDQLQQKLQGAADEVAEEEVRHKEFAEKRKNHYNEMEMVRKWREQHQDEDDDENDE